MVNNNNHLFPGLNKNVLMWFIPASDEGISLHLKKSSLVPVVVTNLTKLLMISFIAKHELSFSVLYIEFILHSKIIINCKVADNS